MAADNDMNRQHAHHLLDQLDAAQLDAIGRLLEVMVDPVTAALQNALADDEPETGEERLAVAEARQWLRQNGGKGIPHEEAIRRLGLD
jgi:hypothetical protein